MNDWLFFALLAPLCWGFTNVLDGAIRRHFVKSDHTLTWVVSLMRLPFACLFFYWGGIEFPDVSTTFWMLFAGLFWLLPILLYFKAIEFEEPTRLALLFQMIPVMTLILAFFMIGETLTRTQGIAFAFLIAGSTLASLRHMNGKFHFSQAIVLILIADFMWSFSDVMFKKLEPGYSSFEAAFGIYIFGSFLYALYVLAIPKKAKKILSPLKGLRSKGWAMLMATSFLGIGGSLSFGYALTLGKASLTTVLLGIQPLLVFVATLLLAPLISEVTKEEVDKKSLLFKVIAFILIGGGLWLLKG